MRKHIPNFLTASNLFCGCLSIYFANVGYLELAGSFIFLAAIFDFADGMAARLLKATSEIGKQLDSLSDLVSFGVAPSFIAFAFLDSMSLEMKWGKFAVFIMAIFSAVRLAKFNIDDRQTTSFIGLPTPANAIFWASLAMLHFQVAWIDAETPFYFEFAMLTASPIFILGAVLLLSILLVAEIPLFSLKFSKFGWKGNEFRFLLLLGAAILILIFYFMAIPFILLLYLILSMIQNQTKAHEIQS